MPSIEWSANKLAKDVPSSSASGPDKDGPGSFLSESSMMPPKPTSGILGKVNKVSKGVQYPMFNGEKGNNNERRGFFDNPILHAKSQGLEKRVSGVDDVLLAETSTFVGRPNSLL